MRQVTKRPIGETVKELHTATQRHTNIAKISESNCSTHQSLHYQNQQLQTKARILLFNTSLVLTKNHYAEGNKPKTNYISLSRQLNSTLKRQAVQ